MPEQTPPITAPPATTPPARVPAPRNNAQARLGNAALVEQKGLAPRRRGGAPSLAQDMIREQSAGPALTTGPAQGAEGSGRRAAVQELPPEGEGYVRTAGKHNRWGYETLVHVLEGASARAVARLHAMEAEKTGGAGITETDPALQMDVKDLNTRNGEKRGGHESHRSGEHADVGFFYRNESGELYNEYRNNAKMATARNHTRRSDDAGRRLMGEMEPDWDAEANLLFVEELMNAPEGRTTRIMIDPMYRTALLRTASVLWSGDQDRLGRLEKLLQGVGNHDNHFHVQVSPTPPSRP